jgi:hypothetical protein
MSKLISHESPISLLQESLKYNDYDYILVHLLEQEPAYLQFFSENCKNGRRAIMDTSIFELGAAFDTEKYAYWVERLQPTEYILPDVLEDCNKTIQNTLDFKTKYCEKFKGKTIGVVQGKNYEEIKACYKFLDKMINMDKIAISFDYSYYKTLFRHPNKWVSFMMGRIMLINRLIDEGILNTKKPHHLLGCSNPMEFTFYKNSLYDFIETIDTSSPIVHGLHDVVYTGDVGNWNKLTVKLADLIRAKPTQSNLDCIDKNIKMFKNYVN